MAEGAILYKKANGVDRVPMRSSGPAESAPWWLVTDDPFDANRREVIADPAAVPNERPDRCGKIEAPVESEPAAQRQPAANGPPAAPVPGTTRRPSGHDWNCQLAQWALELEPTALPMRFTLQQGCVVADRERFLANLQADVRRGPAGPRARFGALQADLLALRAIANRNDSSCQTAPEGGAHLDTAWPARKT